MKDDANRHTPVQRYVDILTDAGFKAVFGDERNKDVLIDLVNVVLPENRHVMDLTYATTEIPGFTLSNKSIRIDLRCTGDDGSVFIVELQCYHQHNFFRRCVEYAAKVYDSGSERGDDGRYDIPPVYFIGLMAKDAPVFDRSDREVWRDRFVSEYTFREKASHDVVDDTIFLIFVELNRFDKMREACRSMADKWMFALKHVGTLDRLPEDLRVAAFERLFEACEISKFDAERKLKYEHDMMTERDYYSILDTYREEGVKEGFEKGIEQGMEKGVLKGKMEGKAEGREEEKRIIAATMKQLGLPIDTIAHATGLSKDEISDLTGL